MKYLSYEKYAEMGGTLDEAAFNDLEYEARMYIDWITFERLKKETTIPEAVLECEYHLIKLIQLRLAAMNIGVGNDSQASQFGLGIASQSNDGVSISYNTLSAKDVVENSQKELNTMANRYLQGVRDSLGHRLLYRGLYPDE